MTAAFPAGRLQPFVAHTRVILTTDPRPPFAAVVGEVCPGMLTTGSHVGHYEIIAPLGAGGMGEVYRAHDSHLGRDVAVKILPSAFAVDHDRVRRFKQEALASGMLNHPNLLTVFDAGTHDGAPYLVSELLEGHTLRHVLSTRPGLKRVLDYAIQIAQGLAAAHEKSIVHRDLKPENIFILADGRVKLLDFGLAKLTGRDEGAPEDVNQTAQRGVTRDGMVVGTVGYMSPEQVRAGPVDHRSDLFSLGIVIFEMLTGASPFERQSSVETMNAIIHDDAPPLDGLPPAIQRLIQHALEKSPSRRFQNALDFAFALESLAGSDPALPSLRTGEMEQQAQREPPLYRRMTFRRGFIMSARFAPDGSVIYGAAWEDNPLEIYSSYQTGPEARPVGLRDCDVLSIAASGELAISIGRRFMGVGYATTGTLARVPLAGGAPRRICQDVQEAEWTRDGKNFLLTRRVDGFYRIESPIGNVLYKTPRWVSRARFSPSEEMIAFIEHPLWGDDAGAVTIIDRSGRMLVQGTESWNSTSGLAWAPSGGEVWFTGEAIGKGRGRDIMAVATDGTTRVVLPVPGRLTLHDISADGKVLVAIENGRREAVAGTRADGLERNLSWFDWSRLCGVSRDGSFIAFEEQAAGVRGLNTVFIRTTDGAPAVRIGEGRARGNPVSSDGEWLAIAAGSPPRLEVVPVGVGEPRAVRCDLVELSSWQFHPDLQRLVVLGNHAGESKQLYDVPIEGDGKTRAITSGLSLAGSFALSHDGMMIAVGVDARVMLIPFEGGEPRPLSGCHAGDVPLEWSQDNRALFVSERGQAHLKIFRVDVESGERQEWLPIRPDDPAGILDIMPVHITPDGETYAYGYRRLLSDLYIVTGLL